jgi:hypothetical protein
MLTRIISTPAVLCVALAALLPSAARAQTGEATLSDALSGSTYDVIVSIKQTGSTTWKLGAATFAFTYDPFAIQFESELEEGNWDNNRFPAAYGDQFSAHYTVSGARSVEVDFVGSNGSGVFLSLLPTVVGKLRFTVLDAGRAFNVRWQEGGSVVYDDTGIDRTSGMTFGLLTAIGDEAGEIPAAFELRQNFPNPFNPSTVIQYGLPRESHVTLDVYNVVGELVARLVDDRQSPGRHSVTFDATGLATGLYVYRLSAGGTTFTNKMMLVK